MTYTYTVKSIELSHITRKERIKETVTDKDGNESHIVRDQLTNVPAYAVALIPDVDTVSAFFIYEEREGPCSYAVGQDIKVTVTP